MSSNQTEFGRICRALRVQRSLKQREVAAAMGVKLSTYGNVESSRWKVVNRDKALKLVVFYKLTPADAAVLLDAWDQCPLSPHAEKRKDRWAKQNAFRSKAKNHDKLKLALVELLGRFLMEVPDEHLCTCEFGSPLCALCAALERLGLDPFNPADRDKILAHLAKQQTALTPAESSSG